MTGLLMVNDAGGGMTAAGRAALRSWLHDHSAQPH
jgi:hypothetical protein